MAVTVLPTKVKNVHSDVVWTAPVLSKHTIGHIRDSSITMDKKAW